MVKRQRQGQPKGDGQSVDLLDHVTMQMTLADKVSNKRIDDLYREVDQRFEASQVAVKEAFLAQQTAMQTAFTAQKLSVDAALAAADRAVNKAELAADKRFEGVNEFRQTLADQQRTLMPRSESELLFRALQDKMESNSTQINDKLDATIKALAEKIDANTRAVAASAGQKNGLRDGLALLVGGVGVVGVFVSIILHYLPK